VVYEHIKRGVVGCVYVFVSNSLRYISAKNWQNWMTHWMVCFYHTMLRRARLLMFITS